MSSVDSAIHLWSARTLYGNYGMVMFEAYPTEMLTSRSQGLQQFRLEADLFPAQTCLTNNRGISESDFYLVSISRKRHHRPELPQQ